jgi:hypothetical protein
MAKVILIAGSAGIGTKALEAIAKHQTSEGGGVIVVTDQQEDFAPQPEPVVMKLEALPDIHTYDIGVHEKNERKQRKKQNQNRQRHFNRNQKLPKGRR